MAGSSGISVKSKSATTYFGESMRTAECNAGTAGKIQGGGHPVYGTIRDIHAKHPWVHAYDDQGLDLACGDWIPLTHDAAEITLRWGTIRQGMRVLINYIGPDGGSATATIVGEQQTKETSETLLPNAKLLPLHRIFTPGIFPVPPGGGNTPRSRVFSCTPTSRAAFYAEEDAVYMVGNELNIVGVDPRGTTIAGAVSFVSDSMHRRSSGLFVGMTDLLQMIPSTIITPIPHRIPWPPIFAIPNIVQDVAFFQMLVSISSTSYA